MKDMSDNKQMEIKGTQVAKTTIPYNALGISNNRDCKNCGHSSKDHMMSDGTIVPCISCKDGYRCVNFEEF